jgi:hypothetical protein
LETGNQINSQINSYNITNQKNADFVTLSNGNIVITWQSYTQDGNGYGIVAKAFDSKLKNTTLEFQVNTYFQGDQQFPSISPVSNGVLL